MEFNNIYGVKRLDIANIGRRVGVSVGPLWVGVSVGLPGLFTVFHLAVK